MESILEEREDKRKGKYTGKPANVAPWKEVRVLLPQARECLEPPEASSCREGFSPGVFRGSMDLMQPC